jgi:hypothetical protein
MSSRYTPDERSLARSVHSIFHLKKNLGFVILDRMHPNKLLTPLSL